MAVDLQIFCLAKVTSQHVQFVDLLRKHVRPFKVYLGGIWRELVGVLRLDDPDELVGVNRVDFCGG